MDELLDDYSVLDEEDASIDDWTATITSNDFPESPKVPLESRRRNKLKLENTHYSIFVMKRAFNAWKQSVYCNKLPPIRNSERRNPLTGLQVWAMFRWIYYYSRGDFNEGSNRKQVNDGNRYVRSILREFRPYDVIETDSQTQLEENLLFNRSKHRLRFRVLGWMRLPAANMPLLIHATGSLDAFLMKKIFDSWKSSYREDQKRYRNAISIRLRILFDRWLITIQEIAKGSVRLDQASQHQRQMIVRKGFIKFHSRTLDLKSYFNLSRRSSLLLLRRHFRKWRRQNNQRSRDEAALYIARKHNLRRRFLNFLIRVLPSLKGDRPRSLRVRKQLHREFQVVSLRRIFSRWMQRTSNKPLSTAAKKFVSASIFRMRVRQLIYYRKWISMTHYHRRLLALYHSLHNLSVDKRRHLIKVFRAWRKALIIAVSERLKNTEILMSKQQQVLELFQHNRRVSRQIFIRKQFDHWKLLYHCHRLYRVLSHCFCPKYERSLVKESFRKWQNHTWLSTIAICVQRNWRSYAIRWLYCPTYKKKPSRGLLEFYQYKYELHKNAIQRSARGVGIQEYLTLGEYFIWLRRKLSQAINFRRNYLKRLIVKNWRYFVHLVNEEMLHPSSISLHDSYSTLLMKKYFRRMRRSRLFRSAYRIYPRIGWTHRKQCLCRQVLKRLALLMWLSKRCRIAQIEMCWFRKKLYFNKIFERKYVRRHLLKVYTHAKRFYLNANLKKWIRWVEHHIRWQATRIIRPIVAFANKNRIILKQDLDLITSKSSRVTVSKSIKSTMFERRLRTFSEGTAMMIRRSLMVWRIYAKRHSSSRRIITQLLIRKKKVASKLYFHLLRQKRERRRTRLLILRYHLQQNRNSLIKRFIVLWLHRTTLMKIRNRNKSGKRVLMIRRLRKQLIAVLLRLKRLVVKRSRKYLSKIPWAHIQHQQLLRMKDLQSIANMKEYLRETINEVNQTKIQQAFQNRGHVGDDDDQTGPWMDEMDSQTSRRNDGLRLGIQPDQYRQNTYYQYNRWKSNSGETQKSIHRSPSQSEDRTVDPTEDIHVQYHDMQSALLSTANTNWDPIESATKAVNIIDYLRHLLLKRSFRKLYNRLIETRKQFEANVICSQNHATTSLKQCLFVWKRYRLFKKKFLLLKRRFHLRSIFCGWNDHMHRLKSFRKKLDRFRIRLAVNLALRVFGRWKQYIRMQRKENKLVEAVVKKHKIYTKKIYMKSIRYVYQFTLVRKKIQAVHRLDSLCVKRLYFKKWLISRRKKQLQNLKLKQKIFDAWQQWTEDEVVGRNSLSLGQAYHRKKSLIPSFFQWRRVYISNSLQQDNFRYAFRAISNLKKSSAFTIWKQLALSRAIYNSSSTFKSSQGGRPSGGHGYKRSGTNEQRNRSNHLNSSQLSQRNYQNNQTRRSNQYQRHPGTHRSMEMHLLRKGFHPLIASMRQRYYFNVYVENIQSFKRLKRQKLLVDSFKQWKVHAMKRKARHDHCERAVRRQHLKFHFQRLFHFSRQLHHEIEFHSLLQRKKLLRFYSKWKCLYLHRLNELNKRRNVLYLKIDRMASAMTNLKCRLTWKYWKVVHLLNKMDSSKRRVFLFWRRWRDVFMSILFSKNKIKLFHFKKWKDFINRKAYNQKLLWRKNQLLRKILLKYDRVMQQHLINAFNTWYSLVTEYRQHPVSLNDPLVERTEDVRAPMKPSRSINPSNQPQSVAYSFSQFRKLNQLKLFSNSNPVKSAMSGSVSVDEHHRGEVLQDLTAGDHRTHREATKYANRYKKDTSSVRNIEDTRQGGLRPQQKIISSGERPLTVTDLLT